MAQLPLGLLGFAAGMMGGAGRTAPHPLGFGEAFGGGLQAGLHNMAQFGGMEADQQTRRLQQMQMTNQLAMQRKEAERQQTLDRIISGLPANERLAAQLDPQAYASARAKSLFAEPAMPKIIGSGEVGYWAVDPRTLKRELLVEPERATGLQRDLMAAGLRPGSPEFAEAILASRTKPATQVNVGQSEYGTIPQGFQLTRDPATGALAMAPIPGGPAELEQQRAEEKAAQRQRNTAMAGGTVVQDLGRGMELLESSDWAAGPLAGQFARIPGTPAHLLNQYVQSVASNIGVDRLQAMRESSPTGGALGQVPFQQQVRLEQLLGSLDITQPRETLLANMKRISNLYMDTIHGTPEQIAERVAMGEVSEREVAPLMRRFELPFDEMGRPVDPTAPSARGPGAQGMSGDRRQQPPAGGGLFPVPRTTADVQGARFQSLRNFAQSVTEEELDRLPAAVRAAIAARLREGR